MTKEDKIMTKEEKTMTMLEMLRTTDMDEFIHTMANYINYGEFMWNEEELGFSRSAFIREWVRVFGVPNKEGWTTDGFIKRLIADEISFEDAAKWAIEHCNHNPDIEEYTLPNNLEWSQD